LFRLCWVLAAWEDHEWWQRQDRNTLKRINALIRSCLRHPFDGVGKLSDAASKPAFIAGDAWRPMTRHFKVEHALRVAEDGRVEVTKALRARLQFSGDIKPVVVD
jgi:Txe/YoeB family toxin of Txe-Axe toxin-antitoxin module